jgi:hypothetical protein
VATWYGYSHIQTPPCSSSTNIKMKFPIPLGKIFKENAIQV